VQRAQLFFYLGAREERRDGEQELLTWELSRKPTVFGITRIPDEPNQQNAHSGISGTNMPCSGHQMNQSSRMCTQKPIAVLATLITTANSQTGRSVERHH
jgi:hypothetical protein